MIHRFGCLPALPFYQTLKFLHPSPPRPGPLSLSLSLSLSPQRRMLRVSEDGAAFRREGFAASYRQLRQSLIDLQLAADQIFDTISDRTAKESKKLIDLSTRNQNAKVRINSITHAKKAVKVVSCSRYPSISSREENFNPLFGYKGGASSEDFPVAKLLVNGGLNRELGVDGTLELYQFFSETTSEFLPKEVRSKGGNEVTNPPKGTFLENLLIEPPDFAYNSFVMAGHNGKDSSLNPKNQPLSLPPSLLLDNSRSLRNSDGFSLKSVSQQAEPFKLRNIHTVSEMTSVGVNDSHPKENKQSSISSTQTLPHFPAPPPPPPLPSLLTTASPSKNYHSGSGSGATTNQSDNVVPSLPIIDSRRAALLASIRNPGNVLRKTGILDHGSSPTTPSKKDGSSSTYGNTSPVLKPKSVNLLAEVASSLKMRRLAMQGAFHGNEQIENLGDNINRSRIRSPSPNEASDLHGSSVQSEEDDWDED